MLGFAFDFLSAEIECSQTARLSHISASHSDPAVRVSLRVRSPLRAFCRDREKHGCPMTRSWRIIASSGKVGRKRKKTGVVRIRGWVAQRKMTRSQQSVASPGKTWSEEKKEWCCANEKLQRVLTRSGRIIASPGKDGQEKRKGGVVRTKSLVAQSLLTRSPRIIASPGKDGQ